MALSGIAKEAVQEHLAGLLDQWFNATTETFDSADDAVADFASFLAAMYDDSSDDDSSDDDNGDGDEDGGDDDTPVPA